MAKARKQRPADNPIQQVDLWNDVLHPGASATGTLPEEVTAEVDRSTAQLTGNTAYADRSTAGNTAEVERERGRKRPKYSPSPGTQPKPERAQPKSTRTRAPKSTTTAPPKSTRTRPKSGTRPKLRPVLLRIPGNILEELETALEAQSVKLKRHTWILFAIHEKAARDLAPKS